VAAATPSESEAGPVRHTAPKLVDLSHAIEHGMVTYPGLPTPVISVYLGREESRGRYAPGTEFQIGRIEMVANTGTYVDAPSHRLVQGADLAALSLARLAGLQGEVIRAANRAGRGIDASFFGGRELSGKAVLVHTGWDVHFGTGHYADGHPYLTEDAARHLSAAEAVLVGIDSLNIDDTADGRRPVHTTLLGQGIPIVEHLTHLEDLPDRGFLFFAVPPRVKGLDSFPVRAFALLEGSWI